MFMSRNKKTNVHPYKLQFYYIKVGLRGSKLYRRVFVMFKLPVLNSTDRPCLILTLCCFVVYSTRRFFLNIPLCYFVILFLCFSVFSIAVSSLGGERANLSAFRTFVRFALVWFCLFPLPLRVWDKLRLVIVALPGFFSYLVFNCPSKFSEEKSFENVDGREDTDADDADDGLRITAYLISSLRAFALVMIS